ncbi:MAG: hypothetical protein FWE24_09365 [Defluviitaleaceae bacterium]|nr:hypothetical protein [Defluviitaleaceae bacterium]
MKIKNVFAFILILSFTITSPVTVFAASGIFIGSGRAQNHNLIMEVDAFLSHHSNTTTAMDLRSLTIVVRNRSTSNNILLDQADFMIQQFGGS